MIKVQDIAFEKPLELLLMKDQKVIQACSSHAQEKTLTYSIGLRGSIRRSKHLDATGGCHSCKIRPELLVIIPDDVLWGLPIVLATSDICSGNGPVLHDGESRLAIAVLTGKNIRWPKGQFHLPDSPFPVARNSMERQRGPLPLALSERKAPSCKQNEAFCQ